MHCNYISVLETLLLTVVAFFLVACSRAPALSSDAGLSTIDASWEQTIDDLAPQIDLSKADTIQPDLPAPKEWATPISSGGAYPVFGLATDPAGNSYIAGAFSGTTTFGSTTLTATGGGSDYYVAKVSPSGKLLWVTSGQCSGGLVGAGGIAADNAGNAYVTFGGSGTMSFGSTTATPGPGHQQIWIAKLSPSGDVLWAKAVQGGKWAQSSGWAVVTDGSGDLYVSGRYGGAVTFGKSTLTTTSYNDLFVTKLNANGKFLWATSATDSVACGESLAVDGAGNAIVAGRFDAPMKVGSHTLSPPFKHAHFVLKLDSSGKPLWAVTAGQRPKTSVGIGVAVDAIGDAIVTGSHDGPATFGTTTLKGTTGSAIFVAKLGAGGAYKWATGLSGNYTGAGMAVVVDGNGSSHLTGFLSGSTTLAGKSTITSGFDILVARVDPGGTIKEAVTAGGPGNDTALGIGLDKMGRRYVGGVFAGTATFGTVVVSTKGASPFIWRVTGP